MKYFKVKNWKKFQHFKDRTPPWIKLYRDILDDPDWHELNAELCKTLVMLWLIASEDERMEGWLPDSRKLSFRLRISEDELNQRLNKLSNWLIRGDIRPISGRYQDDAPETEESGEETEIYICEFFVINKKSHEKYKKAYPKIRLLDEYEKMSVWLESNPQKRKTKNGYPRFINSWLSRKNNEMPNEPQYENTGIK